MSSHSGAMSDILLPRSRFYHGPYGRMFRNLPPHEPPGGEEEIRDIASTMIEDDEAEDEAGDNPTIPAGYIYFGQFLTHDITFDPTSSLQRRNDPDKLYNFRTPRFDLDSLYGKGPQASPFMYDQTAVAADGATCRLLVGRGVSDKEADLPRNSQGQALIGDRRNDENIIISQMHLAFLKFHNQVVNDLVEVKGKPLSAQLFAEAQRIVRWHYQWVVVHDFLRRLVGEETYRNVIPDPGKDPNKPRLRFYNWEKQPYIPVEFSAAAFRVGHTMVRPSYALSDRLEVERVRVQRKKNKHIPVFRDVHPAISNPSPDDLSGSRLLPEHWTIQWNRFLPEKEDDRSAALQMSRRLNTRLSRPLAFLPFAPLKDRQDVSEEDRQAGRSRSSLAVRNLIRGWRMGLPSGQTVARAMSRCIPCYLKPDGDDPLWYYILKEAELSNGLGGGAGEHLGPVGGTIVAEVLLGLLAGDPLSYLNIDPLWTPKYERALDTIIRQTENPNDFQLRDIVKYAGMPMNDQAMQPIFED